MVTPLQYSMFNLNNFKIESISGIAIASFPLTPFSEIIPESLDSVENLKWILPPLNNLNCTNNTGEGIRMLNKIKAQRYAEEIDCGEDNRFSTTDTDLLSSWNIRRSLLPTSNHSSAPDLHD